MLLIVIILAAFVYLSNFPTAILENIPINSRRLVINTCITTSWKLNTKRSQMAHAHYCWSNPREDVCWCIRCKTNSLPEHNVISYCISGKSTLYINCCNRWILLQTAILQIVFEKHWNNVDENVLKNQWSCKLSNEKVVKIIKALGEKWRSDRNGRWTRFIFVIKLPLYCRNACKLSTNLCSWRVLFAMMSIIRSQ